MILRDSFKLRDQNIHYKKRLYNRKYIDMSHTDLSSSQETGEVMIFLQLADLKQTKINTNPINNLTQKKKRKKNPNKFN